MEVKRILDITKEVFCPRYLGSPVLKGCMHMESFKTLRANLCKGYWTGANNLCLLTTRMS